MDIFAHILLNFAALLTVDTDTDKW